MFEIQKFNCTCNGMFSLLVLAMLSIGATQDEGEKGNQENSMYSHQYLG